MTIRKRLAHSNIAMLALLDAAVVLVLLGAAVVLVLLLGGGWMLETLQDYTREIFSLIAA